MAFKWPRNSVIICYSPLSSSYHQNAFLKYLTLLHRKLKGESPDRCNSHVYGNKMKLSYRTFQCFSLALLTYFAWSSSQLVFQYGTFSLHAIRKKQNLRTSLTDLLQPLYAGISNWSPGFSLHKIFSSAGQDVL